MIISIYRLIYSLRIRYIRKYRIAGYENRYRIMKNHPIYTLNIYIYIYIYIYTVYVCKMVQLFKYLKVNQALYDIDN